MRTRRYHNKKNNRKTLSSRKRGGRFAAFTKSAHDVYDKYIRCCRPGQRPDDGAAAAAAVAPGIGHPGSPPGSPPYVRQARARPAASCVPCSPGSPRSPSRSRSQTPSPPRVTMVSSEPTHQPVIQTCINFWRERLAIMRTHMSNLQQYNITLQVIREIKSTARQILVANISLNYWTDVLAGIAQGPRITNPDSMNDEEITRLLGYRTATYAAQLRNSIRGLPPRVTQHTINTFINL
jgi:hypothetical protein